MQPQAIQSYLSYCIEPGTRMIQSEWVGGTDSPTYRESLLHICQVIGQHHIVHWLYTASRHYIPTMSDQTWLLGEFYPLMAQTSLTKFAVVVQKDLFQQLIADSVCSKSKPAFNGTIKMEIFFDAESAQDWLLSETC
ncbi:hypothetical protein GCM10023188_17110 [Pontibacter saemangeumensis]|uniref:SpoIIAA-like n=1 Tax=Pontibacter saemangeumensis TaxID=1084525 RepID=A0ABP8LK40_9BACT